MNKKEQFLSVLNNEAAHEMDGYGFEAFPQIMFHCVIDPISVWDILQFSGEAAIDNWGGTLRFLPGDPGIIPIVNKNNQVIKDITKWKDYVQYSQNPETELG
jgi:hypothetical protein